MHFCVPPSLGWRLVRHKWRTQVSTDSVVDKEGTIAIVPNFLRQYLWIGMGFSIICLVETLFEMACNWRGPD